MSGTDQGSTRNVALALLVLGLAGAGWWWLGAAPAPVVAGEQARAGEQATAPAGSSGGASPDGRKPGGKHFKEGSRTEIPRRAQTRAATTSAPASPTTPAEPAKPQDGPVDRREGAHGSGQEVVSDIQERMASVKDDISECLGAWMEQDPDLEGKVLLTFQIGPEGLQDAWVKDYEDVPFGPLSCFSSAVYAVDWTGVTDEPLEITWPIVFTQDGQPTEQGVD